MTRSSVLSPHLISLTLSSTLLHGEALFVSSLISSITRLISHSVAASKRVEIHLSRGWVRLWFLGSISFDGIPEEAIVSAEHLIDESWMIEQQSNEVDDSEFSLYY